MNNAPELELTGIRPSHLMQVPRLGDVEIAVLNPADEHPADIGVQTAGKATVLEGFAERNSRDGVTSCFPAVLWYLVGKANAAALFLFGLFRVVVLDHVGNVREVLRLNRSTSDDRGFYQPFRVQELRGFFILTYEGGVARIADSGDSSWHTDLKHDDIFKRLDAEGCWFENEHLDDGKEWLVRIEDGGIVTK